MRNILVTGASRGLGLEFTRQYLERGERVFAGSRAPDQARELAKLKTVHREKLVILPLDVADEKSIDRSHAVVQSEIDTLHLLINNAGIYGSGGKVGETERRTEQLGELNLEDGLKVLRVNALAPLLIAQRYLDLLRKADHAKIVGISSGYGSISANTTGFPYYYSASKAALNMSMRSLAADAAKWGIITVLLDPGWVRTDMGGSEAPISAQQSVKGMVQVIDSLSSKNSSSFLDWHGKEQPW